MASRGLSCRPKSKVKDESSHRKSRKATLKPKYMKLERPNATGHRLGTFGGGIRANRFKLGGTTRKVIVTGFGLEPFVLIGFF